MKAAEEFSENVDKLIAEKNACEGIFGKNLAKISCSIIGFTT